MYSLAYTGLLKFIGAPKKYYNNISIMVRVDKEKKVHLESNNLNKLKDILFIASSITFNIAVSIIYIASKIDNQVLLRFSGIVVVSLFIPFTISLIGYIKDKAKKRIIISLIIILFYLFLEVLLDYILKIPFREILAIHVPYIIVFYAAAFSMIGVSRSISRKMGFIVLAMFFILLACLAYTFLG